MNRVAQRWKTLIATTLALSSIAVRSQAPIPKQGFVSNEETAIKIAEAILTPIYGEKQIISERPFHAGLRDGVWMVVGSLPAGWDGGVASIKLDQKTGAVISYTHGK